MTRAAFIYWLAATEHESEVEPLRAVAAPRIEELMQVLDRRDHLLRCIVRAKQDDLGQAKKENLARLYRAARDDAQRALSAVLGDGLRRRMNLLLGEPDAEIFRCLVRLGGRIAPGIAVCRTCGVVFTPRRKGAAERCDRCHHGDPPVSHSAPERVTTVTPKIDTETWTIAGWRSVHHITCRGCGGLFVARADAQICSPRCEKRVQRGAWHEPPPPLPPELSAAVRASCDSLLAAWFRLPLERRRTLIAAVQDEDR